MRIQDLDGLDQGLGPCAHEQLCEVIGDAGLWDSARSVISRINRPERSPSSSRGCLAAMCRRGGKKPVGIGSRPFEHFSADRQRVRPGQSVAPEARQPRQVPPHPLWRRRLGILRSPAASSSTCNAQARETADRVDHRRHARPAKLARLARVPRTHREHQPRESRGLRILGQKPRVRKPVGLPRNQYDISGVATPRLWSSWKVTTFGLLIEQIDLGPVRQPGVQLARITGRLKASYQ